VPPATDRRLLQLGPEGAAVREEPGGPPAGRLRGGVVLPVTGADSRWVRVLTPCERALWLEAALGRPVSGEVALDPGHGGDEPGALGPAGLVERDLNLDVALRAAALLREAGVAAVTTRTADYRATLGFRTAVAAAMGARALVSVHHNAEPDGRAARPGTETYHQHADPSSRRLAGLLYEELVTALAASAPDRTSWPANADAGAKWRLNDAGFDYYGMLRRPAAEGVTACLTEFAFLSDPDDEALLVQPAVRAAEAGALARALLRFLRSDDPGSGWTDPVHRIRPAGPGGGRDGCVDPA
jgi:N-acetylmuramoyl-L-alanine amidase